MYYARTPGAQFCALVDATRETDSDSLIGICRQSISGAGDMSAATVVFMIATYWVGGSAPTEGNFLANGQTYNNKEFVAAHRTLPFGTVLHVCLRRQCVSVVVKDRGPFLPNMDIERRIDLSYAAAKALNMLHDGRQRVRVSVPMPKPRPNIEWQEAHPLLMAQ
jgi:hypothetical protein